MKKLIYIKRFNDQIQWKTVIRSRTRFYLYYFFIFICAKYAVGRRVWSRCVPYASNAKCDNYISNNYVYQK